MDASGVINYRAPFDSRASLLERRISVALIACLLMATVVSLLLPNRARLSVPAFITLFVGSTGTADALAGALLLTLYWIEGQRALLYASGAYVFNALLIVPYALTFPGVIDANGFIGNSQSAAFLWLIWHFGFAVMIMAGTRSSARTPQPQRLRNMLQTVALVAVVALSSAVGATAGRAYLPILLTQTHFTPLFARITFSVSLLNVIAILALLRARPLTTLQLWLMVALAASALDTSLNAITPARYSLTWYVGKSEQFVTASVVLFSMLAAWTTMNAQSLAFAQRLARSVDEQRVLQIELDREHLASTAFQRAALPRSLPTLPGVAFAAVYRAAATDALVGGDWYDAFRLADGRIVLSIGDVMGSGLAAAVTMNAARQAVRGAAQIFPDPLVILDAVDRVMRSERPDTIVTALVAVFDPVTLALSHASAGHPPLLLRHADGTIDALGKSGLPLGLRSPAAGVETAETTTLPDQALIVLYTDGLTESQHDPIDGERRLRAFLAQSTMMSKTDPASEIANAMLGESSLRLAETPQVGVQDDVAILTMRLDGQLHFALQETDHVAGSRWTFEPTDCTYASAARRDIVAALSAAGMNEGQLTTAELIFSELVGNVLRHGGCVVDIVLDMSGTLPALHVLDRGPGFSYNARLPTSTLSESGRGLFIVSKLSHDFTVVQRVGGGSHACSVLPYVLPVEGANTTHALAPPSSRDRQISRT